MVIVNDFEFQIVTAEDKTPFKEHKKGPNTFVEVEPDAEYFLSVRQVRDIDDKRLCEIDVDGKELMFIQVFDQTRCSRREIYGICSWSKGVETMEALKFVKATFTSGDKGIGSAISGMGKIELKVSNAVFTGNERCDDYKASFAPSTIQMVEDAALTMKKNLRSGQGHCAEIENYDIHALFPTYDAGTHLYTITLHYCATPGLIAVGVLPKPPVWDYQRMLNPSNITPKEKKNLDNAFSVKRDRNGIEILVLNDSYPTASEGVDADDPSVEYTSRLDGEFERILRTIFKVKDGTTHEVFEALHYQGIHSWEHFINVEMKVIQDLTKIATKKGVRVPVLYGTKAKLHSLLLLYLKTERQSTLASDAEYYTKDIIDEYLLEERMERLETLKNSSS